jgi:ribosome-associated protein
VGARQERLAGRLASGVLTVAASEQRSQLANRQGARARLAGLLRDAVAPPQRPRVPTRPGRGANERRLEGKRKRSAVKRGRRVDRRDPE